LAPAGHRLRAQEKTCVVTKRWTLFRPRLRNGRIVAVNGEAGLQAATLTPGLHFLLFPWQYAVRFDDLTVIQPGLGKVTLIDGEPISPGRVLGQHVDCNFFQDLSTFLRLRRQAHYSRGSRGPLLWQASRTADRVRRLLHQSR
jgi:uncharacterized membrane protein YqiK